MSKATVKTRLHVVREGRVLVLLLAMLAIFSQHLYAQDDIDLLILNSDHSIKKYALAQDVFLANQDRPSKVINLAEQSTNEVIDLIKRNEFKILYCIGSKAYLLAHRIASDKKIVFSSAINWRRLPVTEESYGIADELPAGMQLIMYRYLFPELKKIGVLYSQQFNKEWLAGAKHAAAEVNIEIIGKQYSSGQNLAKSLAQLLPKIDALWLIADPLVLADRSAIIKLFEQVERYNKPVFTYHEIFINLGALLVISADIPTIGRQVSAQVDKLRNASIIVEHVSNPAGSHVILNMKKLKQYAIKLNKEALGSVNHILD